MAICTATCRNGAPCPFRARTGFTLCGRHLNQTEEMRNRPVCETTLTNGLRCTRPCAEGEAHCLFHVRILQRRLRRLNARRVWNRVLQVLWGDRDVEAAGAELWMAFARNEITDHMYRAYDEVLIEEIAFFHTLHNENPVVVGELQALAQDRQNVHTPAVNQQTRAGLDLLLETPVSSTQNTLAEIQQVWEQSHTRSLRMVVADMRQWYNVETCRTEGDWLYRRTLDGLWAHIQNSPAKDELTERLWEECYESVRMCCDGHISRLCNVLCGFLEEFKPPVSVGELLQQQMAVIAEKDIPVEDKIGEAWAVFEELGIPMEQREAWVDAF